MWSKDFDKWNTLARKLNASDKHIFFNAREVWYCSVGVNIGSEQDGHNELFERPVLILKEFNTKLFWGMALTTKVKPGNSYYLPFRHDGSTFAAIISQLRLFDSKRLVRKLYTISPTSFKDIQLRLVNELSSI